MWRNTYIYVGQSGARPHRPPTEICTNAIRNVGFASQTAGWWEERRFVGIFKPRAGLLETVPGVNEWVESDIATPLT